MYRNAIWKRSIKHPEIPPLEPLPSPAIPAPKSYAIPVADPEATPPTSLNDLPGEPNYTSNRTRLTTSQTRPRVENSLAETV